uniref:RNA helicase n=1 Tax=Scleropages formosus TaxID=113540 RepID=A0A8C9VDE5_SCLFO
MAAHVRRTAHDVDARVRTGDVLSAEAVDFGSLLLSGPVLEGLRAAGFQRPSPIQLKAIPLGRCGLDLIVQAKSGTGKTCVFATIALDSLIVENVSTQVLVLAPTREIAVQIHSVITTIGSCLKGLECHVFIGGTPVSQDRARLKRCHIAIGSPGRVKQLVELGFLSTASVRLFVLDEADKLLEEGSFQEQINWIYSSLPPSKQMLALSATYPESLAQHLARYMTDPTFVRLNPTDPSLIGLKQYYRLVRSHPLPHKVFEEKVQHLFELFSKVPFNQALVFSNLHSRAQHLSDILSQKGLPAACISGSLSQDQRLEAMAKLKQYQCRVLISTDLTSRGIDAEKVNLVVNLDVPQDWETYMHRIGRAGRFGTHGLAVTYCCHGEEENKMMAIAQKYNLNLSCLPDPVPPGLMEEPCDWDVTVENLKMGPTFKALAGAERKKKRVKSDAFLPPVTAKAEGFEDSTDLQTRGSPKKTIRNSEEGSRKAAGKQHRKLSLATDVLPPREVSVPVAPVPEKETPNLPTIPPLLSFKARTRTPMSFEEAVADYESFITNGLGRTVEVVLQFTGPRNMTCDEKPEHLLQPDVQQTDSELEEDERGDGERRNSCSSTSCSSSLSTGGASDSHSHTEDEMEVPSPQTHQLQAESVTLQTTVTSNSGLNPLAQGQQGDPSQNSAPSSHWSHPQSQLCPKEATPQHPWRGHPCKKSKRSRCKPKREQQEMEEHDDKKREDPDGGFQQYWQACYQAWDEYYTTVARNSQQSYNMAYSWMAAYRMNAVYMQELGSNQPCG